MAQSTRPVVNSGKGDLPAGRDTMGRRVHSEPAYTYEQPTQRETHRITANGSVPR